MIDSVVGLQGVGLKVPFFLFWFGYYYLKAFATYLQYNSSGKGFLVISNTKKIEQKALSYVNMGMRHWYNFFGVVRNPKMHVLWTSNSASNLRK